MGFTSNPNVGHRRRRLFLVWAVDSARRNSALVSNFLGAFKFRLSCCSSLRGPRRFGGRYPGWQSLVKVGLTHQVRTDSTP